MDLTARGSDGLGWPSYTAPRLEPAKIVVGYTTRDDFNRAELDAWLDVNQTDLWSRTTKIQSGIGPQDIAGGRDRIGDGSGWRKHRSRERAFGGPAGARIENVPVATTFVQEELDSRTGRRQRPLEHSDFGHALVRPQRMPQPDPP